jgi:hypothetical protein
VGGDEPAEAGADAALEQLDGEGVAEVTVAAADAGLQRRRIARRGEHRLVVIALEDQRGAAGDALEHVLGDRAEVGQDAEAALAVAAAQLERFGGVVGDRERVQLEVADRDRSPSRAKQRRAGSALSPIARQVPRLIQTGSRSARRA